MELSEPVAISLFSDTNDKCPMEPHSKKGFTGKAKGTKSVAELRKAMTKGKSTRQWKQTDTTKGNEKFEKAEHLDGPKEPEPDYGEDCITIAGIDYPLSIAAHHIIPGEASLPKSTLAEYPLEERGHDSVRRRLRLRWLRERRLATHPPDHVRQSPEGKKKTMAHDDEHPARTKPAMSWEKLSDRAKANEGSATSYTQLFLPEYTQQAMQLNNSQFHDSHSNYNDYVTGKLDEIHHLIEAKSAVCQKCSGDDGKKSPPYALVYKLNGLHTHNTKTARGGAQEELAECLHVGILLLLSANPIPKKKLKS